jgi:hypothetical protein
MTISLITMHKKYLLVIVILLTGCISFPSSAQKDSAWRLSPTVKLSGLADMYYTYDFNRPSAKFRQPFLYHYNRHNRLDVNLGYLKLSLQHPKYRANLAVQAGTYVTDNYAAEPRLLKHLFEANAGIALNRKNSVWLDAGILASHIGFETAVSTDNWTLTRSLLAENSPYYLTGAKLTYNPNSQWELAALVCNGWQHIRKVVGNTMPSFGTQVKFSPDKKTVLNWSSFLGTDDPDSTRRLRVFNNLFLQYQWSPKFGLIAGFDIGLQQKAKNSAAYDSWFSPVLLVRYSIADKWASCFRAEYYQDANGVMIPATTAAGFSSSGFSVNLDYSPLSTLTCRIEGRWLTSKDQVFIKNGLPTANNLFMTTSVTLKLP